MRRLPFAVLLVVSAAACSEERDRNAGVAEYDEFPDGTVPLDELPSGEMETVFGFHERARVELYDLGRVLVDESGSPPIGKVYVFYDSSGRPLQRLSEDGKKTEGQAPIVSTLPDRPGYSPFWEIVRVTVPGGYRENDVKSLATLQDRGYRTQATGTVVNCPVVTHSRELADGVTARGEPFPQVRVWFDRLEAFCLALDGAWQAMETGTGTFGTDIRPMDVIYPVVDLFGDDVSYDPRTGLRNDLVLATGDLTGNRLLPAVPPSESYSPLARIRYFVVPGNYQYGNLAEYGDVAEADLLPLEDPPLYRNLSYRGTVAACANDEDCGSGLSCNLDQFRIRVPADPALPGFCDTPPAGVGEHCGPGIARCDSFGGPTPPDGSAGQISDLICIRVRISQTSFCYNACDPDEDDTDEAEDRDSRCGSVLDFQCFGLSRSRKPNGVCIKRCNSLATTTLEKQCRVPGPSSDSDDIPRSDWTCQNGRFDVGETCDPTCSDDSCTTSPPELRWDETTCNDTCSVSTLGADPPEQAEEDEHPMTCILDLCFYPDDRAEEDGE